MGAEVGDRGEAFARGPEHGAEDGGVARVEPLHHDELVDSVLPVEPRLPCPREGVAQRVGPEADQASDGRVRLAVGYDRYIGGKTMNRGEGRTQERIESRPANNPAFNLKKKRMRGENYTFKVVIYYRCCVRIGRPCCKPKDGDAARDCTKN